VNTILADSISAKNQLLAKLGSGAEPELTGPFAKPAMYVFQGFDLRADMVSEAANYLEEFSKKLTP
jgi:hypothetical protein